MKNIIFSVFVFISLMFGFNAFGEEATKDHVSNSPSQATANIFDNESGLGGGTSFDLGFVSSSHTWSLDFTGSPSTVEIFFDCTNDGVNYFHLDTYTGTTDTMRHIVNKPCREVMGNISTLDSGSVTIKSLHGGF